MRELTYLIYIILWDGCILIGTSYIVFILEKNGWWFLLAIFLMNSAYGPEIWIHGRKNDKIVIDKRE